MNIQITDENNQISYNNGEIELNVSIDKNTIWLTQKQLCDIFAKDQSVISRHINNIFNDNEIDEKSNMQKMHIAFSDKPVKVYSLDIVLAVGYRTNSSKAIKFRQWSTSVLKKYIQSGYVLNSDKITNERFVSLENDLNLLKNQVDTISNLIDSKQIKPKQGIFYDGQVFDAYNFVSDLIRDAKSSIVLIDNYIDDSVLTLFRKNQTIYVTIYTNTISKQLTLDLKKYNSQYKNIEIKNFKDSHDRFMIIDSVDVYHIGASLKDLGKKWFGFSRFDVGAFGVLSRLEV